MGRILVGSIETAKSLALTARRNTGEAYCIASEPCGRYWVARKRYAKKIGIATIWDTVGKTVSKKQQNHQQNKD